MMNIRTHMMMSKRHGSIRPSIVARKLPCNQLQNSRFKHHVRATFLPEISDSLVNASQWIPYYTGKSIILFTFIYCTLNWAFYRRQRKDMDDNDDEQ